MDGIGQTVDKKIWHVHCLTLQIIKNKTSNPTRTAYVHI